MLSYVIIGRINCVALLAQINTENRQDLLSICYSFFAESVYDTISLEIPLNKIDEPSCLDSFIIAVCNKRSHKSIQAASPDLRDFTSVVSADRLPQGFPSDLSILTDSREVVNGKCQDIFILLELFLSNSS